MNFFSIAGLVIVISAIALVLRQNKPEYAMLTAIAGGIFILLIIVNQVGEVFDYAEKTMSKLNISMSSIIILFKALGISYISQFASDVCKDSGENAFAGKIELVGKIAIVVVALPLLDTFIEVIQKILG